jgi:hypothetical protein
MRRRLHRLTSHPTDLAEPESGTWRGSSVGTTRATRRQLSGPIAHRHKPGSRHVFGAGWKRPALTRSSRSGAVQVAGDVVGCFTVRRAAHSGQRGRGRGERPFTPRAHPCGARPRADTRPRYAPRAAQGRSRRGARRTGRRNRAHPGPSGRSSERGSRQLVVSGMWRTTICVIAQPALYWARVQYAW